MSKNTTHLEKIRKLLALAESSNESEAQIAREQAERLMVRWGIDEALAASSDNTLKEEIIRRRIEVHGIYALAHVYLANAISKGVGNVKALQIKEGKRQSIELIGYESDVDRVEWMFTNLQLQASSALLAWWGNAKAEGSLSHYSANDKFKARRSFLIAFSGGVLERMKEEREVVEKEYEAHTAGTAVALRSRESEVEDFVRSEYSNLRRGRGVQMSQSGSIAGRSAGRKADVGTTQVSGGFKAVSA